MKWIPKLLETKAKRKVTRKATLRSVVRRLGCRHPYFLEAVGFPLKPLAVMHPTYLVVAGPLRVMLPLAPKPHWPIAVVVSRG